MHTEPDVGTYTRRKDGRTGCIKDEVASNWATESSVALPMGRLAPSSHTIHTLQRVEDLESAIVLEFLIFLVSKRPPEISLANAIAACTQNVITKSLNLSKRVYGGIMKTRQSMTLLKGLRSEAAGLPLPWRRIRQEWTDIPTVFKH